jgi:hypothetical protein
MKLEFRFSISPKPEFYATVKLAALSLRRLGPPYDSARILVSVGDYADLDTISAANGWSEDFPVEWRSVSHELFSDHSYLATHNDRYFAPSDADVIFMCDSDVCLIGRIDDLVDCIGRSNHRMVAGLQAHFAPFQFGSAGNEAAWRRIFSDMELAEPRLAMQYSGDPAGIMGRAPVYFNYGLVAFGREAFAAVAPLQASYCQMMRILTKDSFFLTQIGLSLMIAATQLDFKMLTFAYNCSNDDLPFAASDEFRINDVNDIRVIHYLRNDQFDRRKFLVDPAAYAAFLSASHFNWVNKRLQDHVMMLGRQGDVAFQ